MSQQTTARTCRKTYKEKLRPTPTQERELERVLWRCHVALTRYQAVMRCLRAVL